MGREPDGERVGLNSGMVLALWAFGLVLGALIGLVFGAAIPH